ncbi:MAG TPA: hypothetical protein VHU83_19060 [Bryobacteraceae bacterium]|nr:hypothetical protein [Bryobacteraceae bacterium]
MSRDNNLDFDPRPDPLNPTLIRLSPDGQAPPPNSTIGYAVGIPQGCRANHQPPGDPTYGTPEWIKQIVMTRNAADVPGLQNQLKNASIMKKDPGSIGCGGVSQNVQIYTVSPGSSPVPYDSNLYYVLVADATLENPATNPYGPYYADEIWVCTQDFDHSLSEYDTALNRPTPTASSCT